MLRTSVVVLLVACVPNVPCAGESPTADEVEALRKQVEALMKADAEKNRKIEELQKLVNGMAAASRPLPAETALDRALSRLGEAQRSSAGRPEPARSTVNAKLIDVSLDVLFLTGGSTADEEEILRLQGGGHDPKKRGFTLPQAELSFAGAVDPYFDAEMHLVGFIDAGGDSVIELEEAFATTRFMPFGLQLKAGHFLTEFGRMNATHPHTWNWVDQPIINTRIFGADGMRAPGMRLAWLTPAPWYSQLCFAAQNAEGETMRSFLGNAEGGHHHHGGEGHGEELAAGLAGHPIVERRVRGMRDLVYTVRWENSVNITETLTASFGCSGSHGPNNTGPDGDTWIYGLDFFLKWKPTDWLRTGQFLTWETEIMRRHFMADEYAFLFDADGDGDPETWAVTPSRTLHDWGFFTQVLYGFQRNWAAGLRFEYASGGEDNIHVHADEGEIHRPSRSWDAYRDDRWRISPMMQWRLSEFSRVRFQYNYDRADHLPDGDAHSFWVGLEFLIGAHPAHKF